MAQANPAAAVANIYRTPELWQKITFTFLCLVIYRTGSFITAPGIDVNALIAALQTKGSQGLLGLYDLFVGGALSKGTVFALGIMPYISASIFVQIGGAVLPNVEKMQKDEEGRKKLTQYTRYLTVLLALVQAYGFTLFVSGVQGAVIDPGFGFRMQMVLFLTTGAIFVMWLGEQITERGLGNGASLIIFFSIVERMWPAIFDAFRMISVGALQPLQLVALVVIMVLVVAGTVAVTVAARRVMIQIPQRTMARGRMREASKNFIPLRINAAGVMPIIFAQSVIVVPATIATFTNNVMAQQIAEYFNPPNPLFYVLQAVLIVLFTYFYTSIIFNPIDLSENLKKQGGFIPGVKPGSKTADYIDYVVTRITLPGAVFLTFIALLPTFLADLMGAPFPFGGTSLLIVVGVALDTLAQVQQHLLLRKYDGFMKKGRVRFRGRQAAGGF
jgi:preprotein translocase subunit SecY